MRIRALALADESQRYVRGYPPKGSWLLLKPDIEISRLLELNGGTDTIIYRDERIEPLGPFGEEDLCVAHVDFGRSDSARAVAREVTAAGVPLLLFGPEVTAWGDDAPPWAEHRVVGNVLHVWDGLRQDARAGRLRPVYHSPRVPRYFPAFRDFGPRPDMNTRVQTMNFALGCACPGWLRPFCPDHLYHGADLHRRPRDEVIGEVVDLPHKHIALLDEDVARDPAYYYDMFRVLWNYRRHWTVSAGSTLFRHPKLIRLLAKAGVRVLFLNESFLDGLLERAVDEPDLVKMLYRKVKFLQARRMLVGAKVAVRIRPPRPPDFPGIAAVLRRVDLDFVRLRFFVTDGQGGDRLVPAAYRPMISESDPAWIKNRFYAMGPILDRLARRPRRVGFYTTTRYLLPQSLAYRQNFLEGIASP